MEVPLPSALKFLNRCLQECHTEMDPEALQELTTRELRENIEARYDTIVGVLNLMLEEGDLVRRRKGKQNVLSNPAEDGNSKRIQSEENPPETGSRFSTGSQESKPPGIGSVDRKEKTCPVENQTVPVSPPPYARAGTNIWEPICIQAPRKCGNR